MENLQHDPRTKMQIKDLLYSFLYIPVEKQFKQRITALITRNTLLIGAAHNSFIYRGEIYSADSAALPRRMNRLAPQLINEMDSYLHDLAQLNDYEVPFVIGYINKVLNSSNDLHDYLRLLPKSIHSPIEKLIASCPCRAKHLTDEDIHTIQDNNAQPIALIKQRMAINLIL